MSFGLTEKPGAETPWPIINQLLAADERFECGHRQYLFVPKHPSQLSALCWRLNEKKISFAFQYDKMSFSSDFSVIISNRAFSQEHFYNDGVVEVGAGCSISEMQQFLYRYGQEVPIKEFPLDSHKQTLAEFFLSSRNSSYRLHQESFLESILGIEFVAFDGSQIKWGGKLKGGYAGPSWHRLPADLKTFPGMLVKMFLKTYSAPSKRLQLAWSFADRQAWLHQFKALKHFISSWEYLEGVISGNNGDKCFIYAQISGMPEEMELFQEECPGYASALHSGERERMTAFLRQMSLNYYRTVLEPPLIPEEYLWFQNAGAQVYRLTKQKVDDEVTLDAEWKDRFLRSFDLQ